VSGVPWQDESSKERFLTLLEMEMLLALMNERGETDPTLMRELDSLLKESFPKTAEFVEGAAATGLGPSTWDAAMVIAWAEARTVDGRVPGSWTRSDIERDIAHLEEEAMRRLKGRGIV